jgi:predicted aspartyl protease/tetratricopeptide (TPR) repeat protein
MMMRPILRLCCLGIGLFLASQAWAERCEFRSYGTLPVDMIGGRATTVVKINGKDTRFAVDTGAFYNFMPRADASSLGLKLRASPINVRFGDIGGNVDAEFTYVKQFGILGTTLENIGFFVGGTDTGYGLLGANVLDFDDLEIDLAHGKLTLFQANHCNNLSLAYWAKDGHYNVVDIEPAGDPIVRGAPIDRRTFLSVTINGKQVRALLDSGTSVSALSRRGAERIGIDLKAPDVKAGTTNGLGGKWVNTWIVPIDSFSVGAESFQHSQMEVVDGQVGNNDTDMVLGVDFLLAHHMFIANSQNKAYFTYNGGRVFAFAAPSDGGKSDAGTPADDGDVAPKTASDYALLGDANLSRGEAKVAIADLDEAIRKAPDQAAYYVARARAREADKQPVAALTDLDKSLSLDPKDLDALLLRAQLRVTLKQHTGAVADVTAASTLVPAGSAQARSIAALYIQLDQPAAALPMLDDWIRLHGDDVMLGFVLNERCWARSLSNQMLDDALKDCRKAIKRDGEYAAYLDSLGMVQLRLGHYSESIKVYEQAAAKNPRSAWSRYGLGLAEIRNGQTDAGHADLVAARALDPDIEARAAQYGLTAAGS